MPSPNVFDRQVKQEDLCRGLAFSVIALFVLIFYFPTLFFPPRADQVIYLSETATLHHPYDLIVGTFDHNRHRTIAPGDELLFRPLVYAFLGAEQIFFGHQFWAWQLIGIMAHLVLIWVLLRLLWRLSNPWLAFAGTWFFALSVVNYELVSWPHLSTYMLMMACVIASIEQMLLCFEDNDLAWPRVIRLMMYSFIACFMYETANIFVLIICAALFFSFPKRIGRILTLTIPVVLYALCSYLDYISTPHATVLATAITKAPGFGNFLSAVFHLTGWWLYEGIFSSLYHYVLAIRTMFASDEVMVFKPLILHNPRVILELVALASFVGLAASVRRFSERSKLLCVLAGMLLSYVAVIVVGRYKEIGNLYQTVGVNSYYSYMFWVIVLMMIFSLMVKEIKTPLQKYLVVVCVTVCVLLGVGEGKRIYAMGTQYSTETNTTLVLITTLDELIQEKKSEPQFSFYVDPTYPGNYPYGSIRKINDPPGKRYSFIEFFYPQYFHPRALAKYKFLARKLKV